MNPDDVKALLQAQLPGCEVLVDGEGCNFSLMVISAAFEGQRTLKRQQLVYAALSEQIADGTIHAVNMKTFTPAEWAAR